MKNFKTLMILMMLFVSSLIVAQTSTFKGKVLDELNEPLPGASILVKGTSTVVTTDMNGAFEIDLPKLQGE